MTDDGGGVAIDSPDALGTARAGEPVPAVRLAGLAKHYGDVVAVAGIDLDIAEGFFSMLGPSGSG